MTEATTPKKARPARAPKKEPSLVEKIAGSFGMRASEDQLLDVLRKTAFKLRGDKEVSNSQMMALLVVAHEHGLNPFTKEIYAFDDGKGGIVPVVGVDGWIRIANDNPAFGGVDFRYSDAMIDDLDDLPKGHRMHEWVEAIVHRKDRLDHPVVIREYAREVYKPKSKNGGYPSPWQSHPNRFHRHKVLIQGLRIAFGFGGIYDPDEAERIFEANTFENEPTTRTRPTLAAPTRETGLSGLAAALGKVPEPVNAQ